MSDISLRPAQTKDTQFIYDLYTNDRVQRAHGLHKPIQAHSWRKIIQGLHDGWQRIFLITQGVLSVGHLGFQDHSKDDRRAEVTLSIIPQMQRRGIGREALNQAIDVAFGAVADGGMGVESLWASVVEDNEPSKKLFEGVGFKLAGSVPAYYLLGGRRYARLFYSLLAEK